ncbi:zinc-ribbon domain-containing protein [Algoriphagus resistens]|uniref:zinc-ribbon domain-containing protein n=1 Tax=Algoriphagus resistens TaxID=1750590 RepID=UPI000716C4F1|nr:zinc-ribbon domain-containing protein [Algoriphagus resistens]
MIFFYGTRSTHLKTAPLDDPQIQCQHCHTAGSMTMSVFGKYAHFFWIPLFSIGKTGGTQCNHCKQVLRKRELSPQLKTTYQELKSATKTPVWYFSGLILLSALIVLPLLASMVFRIFG